MLTLHVSNQLSVLRTMLVHLLKVAPLTNPLAREQILVQSPGMAQWLRLELANEFGIAANVEFPLPASFIWQMFTRVLDDVPATSPYNKATMSWHLMVLLPGMLSEPSFSPLRHYLLPDEQPMDALRLWQLCQQIADLFDQYLVYRPDWIAAWEQGEGLAPELASASEQQWQPVLWRALVDRIVPQAGSGYHRANLFADFIEALNHRQDLAQRLPARVLVFGISALPPRYVEALQQLGRQIDVHLFITNPCRHYWGDILDRRTLSRLAQRLKPGQDIDSYQGAVNPLLASMGKQGRDYLQQLLELEANEISFFDDRCDEQAALPPLLGRLQQDVLTLTDRGSGHYDPDSSRHKTQIDPADRSLQIHACHGTLRELEVLHDQLLAMFEADPSLTPKDVVVMMPDVNAYSPAIQAVFGARGLIPYAISDRSVSQENPLLLSLLALLHLPESRLGVGEVLSILEVPAVLARFELDDSSFHALRRWVDAAGVRWGLNDADPERFNLPQLSANSWLFGLRRMLLGYGMGDGEPVAGILPFAELEGQAAVNLGKLAAFIETLEQWLPVLQQPAPLSEWRERLLALMASFYRPDEHDERALETVHSLLQEWLQCQHEAGFTAPLTPALFYDLMKQALSNQRSSQRFLAGQVNFCTLMPMRSIPFRQVCLLGMNDGVYPRTLTPMGFDLLAVAPRRGDRSRRDDDRYLFLEALLSAQQGLYISYQGFSVQDNSPRVPSVLLAELLDYCQQGFVLAGDEALADELAAKRLVRHLTVNHPLTPYSPRYFYPEPDSRLFTYAEQWLPALRPKTGQRPFQGSPLPLPAEWGDPLELAELLRFYRQPARYFLNRRLKVWFEPLEGALDENEPFTLDTLQLFELKRGLLEGYLQQQDLTRHRQRLLLSGQLPQGEFGRQLLEEYDAQMRAMADRIQPYWQGVVQHREVNLDLQLCRPDGTPLAPLQGWLALQGAHQLYYKPGNLHGRDLLQVWIQHLCLALSGGGDSLLFDSSKQWRLLAVAPQQAHQALQALVQDWQRGLTQPLPLFAKTAWAWYGKWLAEGDSDAAATAARAQFNDGFDRPGEGADPYVRRCFPELDDATLEAMAALAECHLAPLSAHLQPLEISA
ncbi:exodeoxyribonuclease V subunit gamma [Pseudaeromonas sharmana]|uniref:RecBCD enzyme subunit RecC n=1 Tax=Pseudaeromonas sharmana TaxID=328412 RepID=A0ABV8CPP2_9GAMM